MRSKARRERPNYDAQLRAVADYGSSTPELDRCIAEAERERRRVEASMRNLIGVYGEEPPPKAHERYLEIKTPTYHPHSQSETRGDPFLSMLNIEPPKAPQPDWMQRLKSVEDRLGELREILWADVELWKRVAADVSAEELVAYIHKHYGLDFPPLPAVVWRQMVQQPQKRDKLLDLHRIYFSLQREEGKLRDLGKKLPPKLAGDLLWEYLRAPGLRHTHVLASQELEPSTLRVLRSALLELVKDVEWCQANPGVVPPRIALNPPHAPKDIVRARRVEKFVQYLLSNPALSNGDLAELPVEGTYDAKLKWAARARDLAQFREGEAVKRYSRQHAGRTFGQKPSHPQKAASNRKTSPA